MMSDLALERRVIALFEQLLDIAEPDREAWIEQAADGDRRIRDRLLSMLAADRVAQLQTGGAADGLIEERAPERIGAYLIGERIGRGGMGSVYRGERAADDFRHTVAIKIIKPGLLSEALVERFVRERQLLARLSHPHIARLYDGGETESGSPYIVMEYVDGVPLLDWTDEHRATRAQRLRLFAETCDAVAFAHQSLIVHRDITPSNILVTPEGSAKLIDFGIARPVDSGSVDRSASPPSLASLSLTPGYAAPERLVSAEVTTGADIYSLGKILEKMMADELGNAELRAIVARATAPAPQDRYPTAEALAADIQAWAAGRPVAAMEGGRRYHLAKFVGRHRPQVALAALVLLLLVSALVVTQRALGRAEAARAAEAARFAELRSLANYMLFDLNGQLQRVIGNSAARLGLADRAQRYLSALANSRDARPELRLEGAAGLVELARIQGVPGQPNLGQRPQARANLDRAVTMLRAPDLPAPVAGPLLGEAMAATAWIQAHGETDAKAAAHSVAAGWMALNGVPAANRGEAWLLARSELGRTQMELALLDGDGQGLLRLADGFLADIARWPAQRQRGRAADLDRAQAAYYRGLSHNVTDRLDESVTAFQEAQRRFEALDRAQPNVPFVLYMLVYTAYVGNATAQGLPGRTAEAAAFLLTARRTVDRLRAIDPQDASVRDLSASLRATEAQALSGAGRHGEALALQQQVVADRRAAIGPERKANPLNRLVVAEVTLGNVAKRAGDRSLACASYDSAGRVLDELLRRKEAVGFVEAYREGIADNVRTCASAEPLSRLVVLDGS